MAKRKSKPLDMTIGDHHWVGLKPDLKYLGFVYIITNKLNGMSYIGRKNYWQRRKGKRVKQHDWNYYTGSSKKLNKDIKKLGIENFEFRILQNFNTPSGLRYGEAYEMFKRDVLTSYDVHGKPLYYNGRIDMCSRPNEWFKGRKRIDRSKK